MKEHLKEFIEKSTTPSVRGLRILLEYFYAMEVFEEIMKNGVKVISVFGSARTKPESVEYRMTQRLGNLLYKEGYAVVTGASRGIMQAANQGVADAIAQEVMKKKKLTSLDIARETTDYQGTLRRHSVGLSISLPLESKSNPYVGVDATFHYFMVRKFFFGTLSSAFIACEGGWGTRDELFEILTLVQTGKAPLMPIIYLSSDPKHLIDDLKHTLKKEYISQEDLCLLDIVKTPEQAVKVIRQFYRNVENVVYDRVQSVRVAFKRAPSVSQRRAVEKILRSQEGSVHIEWAAKEMVLHEYNTRSYGYLKRAIDVLNKV